jgi:ribosome-binding protein aMBF1 (putative translation factor)
MSAPMRTPLIDTVELRFIGPAARRQEAIEALKTMGFMDVADSVPWRECFPDLRPEELPGRSLRGARAKEGLTQRELAHRTGIPQRHISEMENGKRPIGKEMAKRLGKALNLDPKVFL